MKNQTLGSMIASLRKEQGMTQLELAEKMGVTDKAVSKWERDLSCPDVNTIPKLAETFGVSVDELMQVNTEAGKPGQKKDYTPMVHTVLKSIALAMGIAVATLSFLNQIEVHSAMSMLGMGLACLAVTQFPKENP